jgi:hypothetical protein
VLGSAWELFRNTEGVDVLVVFRPVSLIPSRCELQWLTGTQTDVPGVPALQHCTERSLYRSRCTGCYWSMLARSRDGLIAATCSDHAVPDRIHAASRPTHLLLRYGGPLNVRELEQALRAAVTLVDDGEICAEHRSDAIRAYVPPSRAGLRPENRVRECVIALLREQGGNVTGAGRAMDKAPVQIRRWVPPPPDRPRPVPHLSR